MDTKMIWEVLFLREVCYSIRTKRQLFKTSVG